MRVLVLTKYGQLAASTRYRFSQFAPSLERDGIRLEISPLFSDRYLEQKYAAGKAPPVEVLRAVARRCRAFIGLGGYDAVVVYLEALPYLPSWFESVLHARRIPYAYDFDDAIFHQYDRHRLPLVRLLYGKKIQGIIRDAASVWAGNEYLATFARASNAHVEIVPTVVDTRRYTVTPTDAGLTARPFTVGWMGSPSTAPFVVQYEAVLQAFCREADARVVLVGTGPLPSLRDAFTLLPWKEESEVEDLQAFDVGIMPLPDTDWARGKCGFKLIQYMACGIPVVASPVGVNRQIVEHGVNGFLAETAEEWRSALEALCRDPDLRASMGRAGRQKVERSYSLQSIAPRLTQELRRITTAAR